MLMIFLPLIFFFLSILFMVNSPSLSSYYPTNPNYADCTGFSPHFKILLVLYLFFFKSNTISLYVASLASNEAFKFSLLSGLSIITCTLMSSLTVILLDLILMANNVLLNLATSFSSEQMDSTPFFIYQIYNFPAAVLTLFIILDLLLTLIVIVKITAVFFSPLLFSK